MKICYHQVNNQLLVRVNFNGSYGYSSYIHHENLGYPPINHVLENPDFLIHNCHMDAFVFQNYLHESLPSFKNHSLFYQNEWYELGESYKVKLTGKIAADLEILSCVSDKRLRIDCNYKYSRDQFELLMTSIKHFNIEYVEDPIPFNMRDYVDLSQKYPIAIDHEYNLSESQHREVKNYICRPTIRTLTKKSDQLTFSNQFGDILDTYHSYCYLLMFGDLSKEHGIFNPFQKHLYKAESANITLKLDPVLEYYTYLRGLAWISLN